MNRNNFELNVSLEPMGHVMLHLLMDLIYFLFFQIDIAIFESNRIFKTRGLSYLCL